MKISLAGVVQIAKQYHLMPVNKKFLKVANPGIVVRRDFLDKYSEVGELYLRRVDLGAWAEPTGFVDSE